jgi:DNA-binding NarL/FixJ family response regulator
MQTRLLLVDSHAIFRDAVRQLIEKREDLCVAGEAADGSSVPDLVEDLDPDLVVTEIALPHLSGIEVIRRVLRSGGRARFLILASQAGRSQVEQALAAGASAFVCKSDPARELFQAIDAVRAGHSYVSPTLTHHLVDLVARGRGQTERQNGDLTSREREILQLIAEGLSSKETASELGISIRTVESHRANLMEKLGIHKISGLVRFAIREGLLSP